MIRIRVPTQFWLDHADRYPSDEPIGGIARPVSPYRCDAARILIEGTPKQIECLRADAAYYADPESMDELPAGLRRSAARTLEAIRKALQGRSDSEPQAGD